MIRLTAIAVAFCALVLPALAMAQSSLAEGGKMRLMSPKKDHSYARVTFSDGSRAERFTLKAGDCIRRIGDCDTDRERIEFYDDRKTTKPGDERWYAWSIYIPADFPVLRGRSPNYILGQVHQFGGSGPEVLLMLQDDGLHLKLSDPFRLDDDPMNPIPDFRRVKLASQSAVKGKWQDFLLQARWSRGEDGQMRLWRNGREVWSYRGANTNANDPLYFKYGIYRSFVSRCGGPCPDASVYFRNVRIGRSKAEVTD